MEFEATVEGLSEKGFGLVRQSPWPGRIFFVRGSWPGDRIRANLESDLATLKSDQRYHFAKLLEILEPSADRQSSPCPYFGLEDEQCFGCSWSIVPYPAQLRQKQARLQHEMQRVGLDTSSLLPILAAPDPWGYRSRAQFKTDGKRLGYAGKNGKSLAPIGDCLVLNQPMRELLQALLQRLPQPEWAPTPPEPFAFIDCDDKLTEVASITINKRRPFQQPNKSQNLTMKHWLTTQLKFLNPEDWPVLELFGGSGNFTEVLSQLGFTIVSVEISRQASLALKERMLNRVTAVTADLSQRSGWRRLRPYENLARLLVTNPPRTGFGPHITQLRNFPNLAHIFYISCDAKTFARDTKKLEKMGFSAELVQPVDQLPQTPHLEILAYLRRSESH